MSGFNMNDYVDVSERVRQFSDKYPEGSLQSELQFVNGGWLCKAFAYRSPSDERPGIGHAFEPVPGKTPYTKDSEAMNAETSAWGRAIVALGFETKKIASRQEVAARQSGGGTTAGTGSGDRSGSTESKSATRADASPSSPAQKPDTRGLKESRADFAPPPSARAHLEQQATNNKAAAGRVVKKFGGAEFNGKTIAEIAETSKGVSHLGWVASDAFQPKGDEQKHFKQAAKAWLGQPVVNPDDDIPF